MALGEALGEAGWGDNSEAPDIRPLPSEEQADVARMRSRLARIRGFHVFTNRRYLPTRRANDRLVPRNQGESLCVPADSLATLGLGR